MGFAWVLVAAMIIETIMLAWLRIELRKGNRDFEQYLQMTEGAVEDLPKVPGSKYSRFLESKHIMTKKELYGLLEEENVGEWSPFSLVNVIKIITLACSTTASLLFVIILIIHPGFTEAHAVILFASYTGWFAFFMYAGIIRQGKERSAIAARALMRAGRIKFSAMELPG